jgi:hypothetical protein
MKIFKKNIKKILSIGKQILVPLLIVVILLNFGTSYSSSRKDTSAKSKSNKSSTYSQKYSQTRLAQNSKPNGTKIAEIQKDEKNSTHKNPGQNRIKELRERQDGNGFQLYLELADYDSSIKIVVLNMLGKKVIDVYEGLPNTAKDYYYDIPTSELSNGVFVCIVQGKDFRLAEKFIISR